MKILFLFLCSFGGAVANAQELFTFSEPASNMPVKSIAVRMNNYVSQQTGTLRYRYSVAPEFMIGISKELMFHAEIFSGNNPNRSKFDGASLYAKYRFYSEDEVHSHFRLSAYGKIALSNNVIEQQAIQLGDRNSGSEIGMVATKLQNRAAYSAGVSFLHAFDNANGNKFALNNTGRNALNYNLSFGRLFLPIVYENYEQVNMTGMLELLGQVNFPTNYSYIDLAPSLQFIFLSKIRVDAGYRFPLVTSIRRISEKGFLLRVEYNFFSAFK